MFIYVNLLFLRICVCAGVCRCVQVCVGVYLLGGVAVCVQAVCAVQFTLSLAVD